jgi:hypothetical protein
MFIQISKTRALLQKVPMEARLRYQQSVSSAAVKQKLGIESPKRPSPKKTIPSPRAPAPEPEPRPPPSPPRIDFVQRNIDSASDQKSRAKQPRSPKEQAMHSPGEVPRYIEARKATIAAENSPRPKSQCPPGMRLLSEEEKEEALRSLKEQKEELTARLGRMPLRIEGPTAIREERMLETELGDVERSIEQLSKKYVYVPDD